MLKVARNNQLKVGLLGFGKTGSLVAKELVIEPDFELAWVCRKNISENQLFASHSLGFDKGFAPFVSEKDLNASYLEKNPVDLIIDFSTNASVKLYDLFSSYDIKIVSTISNYTQLELELVTEVSHKTPILASPNITLGINWLLVASKLLQQIIPHADIEIVEEHFRDKSSISGTALKLAEHLNIEPKQHVNSIRVGGIVGKHEVIFGLPHQTLRLTHESVSRSAFGTGAIFAGKWLMNKPNGLYRMENLVHEKFVKHIASLEI